MSDDALYPIADAEQLVKGFLECELEKGEFTHEAHLLSGLYMLAHHGDETLSIMRTKLADFLRSMGVESTDTSGYHETMTIFWLWVLKKHFADENGQVHWTQENVDAVIDNPNLTNRNLWLSHYSKEKMMSVEARRGFVDGDVKVLD